MPFAPRTGCSRPRTDRTCKASGRPGPLDVEISPDRPAGGAVDVEGETVWIAPPGDMAWARELANSLVAGGEDDGPSSLEIVLGSHDVPGARLLDLVDVMGRLRRECPWTRLQTHESLAPYVLEEAQETFEALESGDTEHLREELGDLLMQVVFHAAVAAEGRRRRIPHRLGHRRRRSEIAAKGYRAAQPARLCGRRRDRAEEVDATWQRIKARGEAESDGFDHPVSRTSDSGRRLGCLRTSSGRRSNLWLASIEAVEPAES